ncbi:MAG: hypothetical protein ACJ75J_18355, partial [Cytophagaceae bacterium]
VLQIDEAGALEAAVTPGGSGDLLPNADGRSFVRVSNASGSPITATITAQNTTSYNDPNLGKIAKTDRVVTIAAGAARYIGPFAPGAFNNSSGQVAILCSATSSVTIQALKY